MVTPATASGLETAESFDAVFSRELQYVRARRSGCGIGQADERGASPSDDLCGLALSGGGIRSAIFNLGVLQALQRFGAFHRFDYMSTVSGGGYIGTCLSVLMREPRAVFPFVARSQVLRWLRERSQYLEPGGLWLRGGSIVLMGVAINLLTLAPVILLAALVIALYGRFRLAGILGLSVPAFDPLFLLGILLVLLAGRSLVESLLQKTLWPFLMQLEWDDRMMDRFAPEFRAELAKKIAKIKTVMAFLSPLAPILMPFLFLFRPVAALSELSAVADLWSKKDWKALRQKSLLVRQQYRKALEWTVVALALFGFLELQPLILRAVHEPPFAASGLASIELWTAVISLAAAVASILSVNGASGWGAALARFAPATGTILGSLSLYLLCLLVAEKLLFDLPRSFWAGDALLNAAGALTSRVDIVGAVAIWTIVIVGAYLTIPWLFFELNERSIHAFYRDSLGTTFVMGASATGGIESEGDLKLSDLNQHGSSAPYQLFNATLNLQSDSALRNTGRYGDFFVFTRDVYGSDRTRYAPTYQLERCYGSFTVSSAMATSGAAASPHMGIFSRRSFVLIMSLLNIRLGCWLPNPAYRQPQWWRPNPFWLFREMFGFLDANHRGVYVSDGGHLDNTGIYQLLKRRCQVIVAVDATTDPDITFECLADVKRYARVDLGVEIEIDVGPLKKTAQQVSYAHWVCGRIEYPATDSHPASDGRLFLIKSSLTGDEDVETQAYQAKAPLFPHEPLSDQFFDEGQFEAYALLGYHAAASMLQSPDFSLEQPRGPSPTPASVTASSSQ